MTYQIEGELVREERPERYLNRFVDFQSTRKVRGDTEITNRKCIVTTSEKFAHWLNKRGHNLQWNEDLERAMEMCERKEIEVSATKLFRPLASWEEYLTQKFGDNEDEKTVNGELHVWRETRVPTPWLYAASFGKLEDVYVFKDSRFSTESGTRHEGKKFTYGILLDAHVLNLRLSKTRTSIMSTKFMFR